MSIFDQPAGNVPAKGITAAGQTGAKTINANAGCVRFAAAATSLVVTNNLVTTNSVINVTQAGSDGSAVGLFYTPGNGSFTIGFSTGPGAELRVDFSILN